jgi:hypothetical protein
MGGIMPNPIYSTVYHPSYLPKKNWTKLQLLFWDKIYRIVPYPMNKEFGDEKVEEIFNIAPEWLPTISPDGSDLQYFDEHESSIKKAFDQLKGKAGEKFNDLGNFGVHPMKAPQWLFEYLENLGLAQLSKNIIGGYTTSHHLVHPYAGELILSCLSDSIAQRRALNSITDRENNYCLTVANNISPSLNLRFTEPIESRLAFSIFETSIPNDLEKLTFKEIFKLRDDYGDLRKAFHKTMLNLSEEYKLKQIIDVKTAKDQFESCVKDYLEELRKFNSMKGQSIRFINDWKTQVIGVSLGAIATAITGGATVPLIFSFGGISFSAVSQILKSREQNYGQQSFQYLQKLNEAIDAKEVVKNILEFSYPVHGLA